MKIPTYGPDGQRRRSFSLDAILHLESLSLVAVRRNRRGTVTRAHFRAPDGDNPLRAVCRLGQRYSLKASSNGVRFWEFADFLPSDFFRQEGMDERAANAFLRDLFSSVALSCMAIEQPVALLGELIAHHAEVAAPPRLAADVVCIDDLRPHHEKLPLAA